LTAEEARNAFQDHLEITRFLDRLIDLGLGHLTLGRTTPTLSGGEAQRLKLAKNLIESKNKVAKGHCVYILDEPTTGLNGKDYTKLFSLFDEIIRQRNTVIVIEHNLDLIRNADYVIDLGPGPGSSGGMNIFSGNSQRFISHAHTPTAKALRGECASTNSNWSLATLADEERHTVNTETPRKKTVCEDNCQFIYLTENNFQLEEYLNDHFTYSVEDNCHQYFKKKETLFSHVAQESDFLSVFVQPIRF